MPMFSQTCWTDNCTHEQIGDLAVTIDDESTKPGDLIDEEVKTSPIVFVVKDAVASTVINTGFWHELCYEFEQAVDELRQTNLLDLFEAPE